MKRNCKICSKEFKPFNSLQSVCSAKCAVKFNSEKEVKKRVSEMKKELKTHSDYINALQLVFNKYIRIRDKDKPCISCGCVITGTGHASHYFSVGAYPNLRFNEDNVHLSCERCNTHLHGNLIEYSIRLPNRIGLCKFEALKEKRNEATKLSIPEILIKMKYYKDLLK